MRLGRLIGVGQSGAVAMTRRRRSMGNPRGTIVIDPTSVRGGRMYRAYRGRRLLGYDHYNELRSCSE
jgi:hypothetical protein